MPVFTTEIASEHIISDNPIHQRLLKPYYFCAGEVEGDLLEIGCGEGRGVQILGPNVQTFTGIDKIGSVVEALKIKFPDFEFKQAHIPPLEAINSESYDFVVSFQVIEHIKDDLAYLREVYRVLRPGGKAFITTPNIKMSLTRNPWHVREYTAEELLTLTRKVFEKVETRGITGNERVMDYYNKNKRSVQRITRWDVFNLQYRLPATILRIPYDILNRINRNRIQRGSDGLVEEITHEDYLVTDRPGEALDLFYTLEK